MAKKAPKKQGVSLIGFDAKHIQQTEAYTQAIDALYNQAVNEYATMAGKLSLDPTKPFAFKDYPGTKAKAEAIANKLASNMQAVIVSGSTDQWLYACKKNDLFLESIIDTTKVPKATLAKFQDKNLDALKTFQSRKTNGLGLSDRIWNYTGQMKDQMELGIDIALGDGRSASALSRDLRSYLVDPDKLFRRVRDKHGNLVLSKAAKAFHPGQGKYRSSYKNAMRLTRSEINMAYRESDQLRWKNLDFVVGYEVKLSNNHTLNGVPFVDICDSLKGKYPKDFKFKGWHPQCRCHVIPVMQDPDEFNTDELNELKAAINGDQYNPLVSANTVTDVPKGFKDWIAENAERAKGWKSQPYFIKDNFSGGIIGGGLKVATKAQEVVKTLIQKASFIIKSSVDVLNRTKEVGANWFNREFRSLDVERRRGVNGSTDRNGSIWLTKERMDNTISGINKLSNGADITLKEADSIATYWHEITHCRNKTTPLRLSATQRSNMELANEFVARKTLPEFYEAMGSKIQFQEFMINRESTGYNHMVCNYEKTLEVLGLDKLKAIDTVKECLFNKPYSAQIDGLVDAIYIQKAKDIDGKVLGKMQIKSLIKRCGFYQKDKFEEIISKEFKKIGG